MTFVLEVFSLHNLQAQGNYGGFYIDIFPSVIVVLCQANFEILRFVVSTLVLKNPGLKS